MAVSETDLATRVISADCHVNEPPHVFEGVPAKFRDRAPKIVVSETARLRPTTADPLKAVCAAERVPFLDLLSLFSPLPDPHSTWVTPFDAHPNARTNRRAALEILREFGAVWRH